MNNDIKYMNEAISFSHNSDDPNTKVGAVIVNKNGEIIGKGCNHFPNGNFPTNRDGEWINTKYPYIIHAEMDALINSNQTNLKGCKIYVTLAPCNECAKNLANTGIEEVIYKDDKYSDVDSFKAGKKILTEANIKFRQLII